MSHASNSLNPTEQLKVLLNELESEKELYEWLLEHKIYTNYSHGDLVYRINALTPEIQFIKQAFES